MPWKLTANFIVFLNVFTKAGSTQFGEQPSRTIWGDGDFFLLLYPVDGQCFESLSKLSFALSISDRFYREHKGRWKIILSLSELSEISHLLSHFEIDLDNPAPHTLSEGMVLTSPPFGSSDFQENNPFHTTKMVHLNLSASCLACNSSSLHEISIQLALHNCREYLTSRERSDLLIKGIDSGLYTNVLLNVALNKLSVQSSTAHHNAKIEWAGDAGLAVDGVASIDCDASHEQHARTQPSVAAEVQWWEVDLGEHNTWIERVDVWTELVCRGPGSYPPFSAVSSTPPIAIRLLTTNREQVNRTEFRRHSALGLFTWRVSPPPHVRYVRIERLSAERGGASGGQGLALLEVQVFARTLWDCHFHCQHGDCPQGNAGPCRCDPEWSGLDCSLLIPALALHLPPAPTAWPSQTFCEATQCSSGGGPLDNFWNQRAWDEMQAAFRRNQHPATQTGNAAMGSANTVAPPGVGGVCGSGRALVFRWENSGLAATIFWMAGLLGFSLAKGRAMVLSGETAFAYADGGTCPARDFSCLFELWTNCSDNAKSQLLPGSRQPIRSAASFAFLPISGLMASLDPSVAPIPPGQHRRLGTFWWRMAAVGYLFRPRPDVLADLELSRLRDRLGWPRSTRSSFSSRGAGEDDGDWAWEPVVGLHARGGHGHHVWSDTVTVEAQAEAVVAAAERYGARAVYVATNDPDLVDRLRVALLAVERSGVADESRESGHGGIRVMFLPEGESGADRISLATAEFAKLGVQERLMSDLQGQESKQARFALADLLLLASTDAIVCQLGSNFSRLAWMLMAIRQRRLPPIISLDGPLLPARLADNLW